MCEALAQEINLSLLCDRARVCFGDCCFCGLTNFSKDLVMSPCVPTFGKGICAIAEHVMQCLGPATEPAFGVFHQTPLLQIVPGGQLVVHWPYHEGKSELGHFPHIAPGKGSLHYVFPRCPSTLLWLLNCPCDSVLFHFSPPFLVNHSGSGWWARLGPFWQVVSSNCMTVRLGRTSHFFEHQLG